MFSDELQGSCDGFWDSWANWQMCSLCKYNETFYLILEFICEIWKRTLQKVTHGSLVSIFVGNIVDSVCFTVRGVCIWTLVNDWGFFSNMFDGTGSFTMNSMWCFVAVFESSWMHFRVWTNNGSRLISGLVCGNECDDCKESDGLQTAQMKQQIVWSN